MKQKVVEFFYIICIKKKKNRKILMNSLNKIDIHYVYAYFILYLIIIYIRNIVIFESTSYGLLLNSM